MESFDFKGYALQHGIEYDFCGWATRANLRCSDGRTILRDAFKDQDGATVPLVWNHQHGDNHNILGHALLVNVPEEGVATYAAFNETESGQNAKLLVQHGDVTGLSILANQLQEKSKQVAHGMIREVSLVLAGANPGAYIRDVIRHSDDDDTDETAIIFTGESLDIPGLSHAEESNEDEETVQDVFNTLTEKQKKVVYALIGEALSSDEAEHGDSDPTEITHAEASEDSETVQDVFNTLNEKQKKVVYALVGEALAAKESEEDTEDEEETEGEEETVKHNVFDQEDTNMNNQTNTLSHSELQAIFADMRRYGSLRDSFLAHGMEPVLQHSTDTEGGFDPEGQSYGVQNIDYLFPDARNVLNGLTYIQRDTGWVSKVMNGVRHTPFSRIKSIFADITMDEARAKGYVKGKQKVNEVFALLRRTTTPTTVYKKQKLDRDDVVDIVDIDVVAEIKREMRGMLNEEIARAILIGDGRVAGTDDKISEDNIRPIMTDEDLYTVKGTISVAASDPEDELPRQFIRKAIRMRKDYKGSGNPTLFTTEDMVANCLLMEDANGRFIYETVDRLAAVLRVKEIVTVPVMENVTGPNGGELLGIFVNLNDYNVGADKGGAVNMFDDFDIDYNAQKYLIETRCSGALVRPYSAMVIENVTSGSGDDSGN